MACLATSAGGQERDVEPGLLDPVARGCGGTRSSFGSMGDRLLRRASQRDRVGRRNCSRRRSGWHEQRSSLGDLGRAREQRVVPLSREAGAADGDAPPGCRRCWSAGKPTGHPGCRGGPARFGGARPPSWASLECREQANAVAVPAKLPSALFCVAGSGRHLSSDARRHRVTRRLGPVPRHSEGLSGFRSDNSGVELAARRHSATRARSP
jgi:hypothetical protein